jgi:AraC-like DNA-binding protein
MRQSPDGSVWVRTYPLTLDRDQVEPTHTHEWDQFTYAASGVIRVETAGASWMVPPHAAVWVPSGVPHAEYLFGPVSVRTLYFARAAARALPRRCRTVNVPSLLRELVLHIARIGALDRKDARQARLIGVLLDQLATVTDVPLQLPMPSDDRARRVATDVQTAPSAAASVTRLARRAGAGRRTIERLFLAETKMTVGEWRRRARLLHGMRRLSEGASVTEAALDAGYSSVSAFIATFRKTFGVTPGRYQR